LIALKIKQENNIPWLADFRDPWTQIDFYDKLMLSKYADKKHKQLEKQVLENADVISTVSNHCALGLKEIVARKIEVITNGYDTSDFEHIENTKDQKFSITHLGSMNPDRNAIVLWDALASLSEKDKQFKNYLELKFIGKTDFAVFEALKERGLEGQVSNLKYLPHDEALEQAAQSSILLLALNNTPNVKGIAPGKLYEYLALKRPILCVGPEDGDAAEIIENAKAGKTVDFGDSIKMKEIIGDWYTKFKNKDLQIQSGSIEAYSRKSLTQKLSTLLKELTEKENN
jgi:glycosyltransferase involved in cell wall biosynthesis